MNDIADDLARLLTAGPRACGCDFCTGKKRWNDNWCPRCAEVQMQPPKWWEDLDVCDKCEAETAREVAEAHEPTP